MKINYLRLKNGDPMPQDGFPRRHKTVLIIEGDVDRDWQHALSGWIAKSGCLYFMAWGDGCSSWDDSVDIASLKNCNPDGCPEEDLIMTTWHDEEALEEVFWFAKHLAKQGTGELQDILLLHIGTVDRKVEFERLYCET